MVISKNALPSSEKERVGSCISLPLSSFELWSVVGHLGTGV